MSKKDKATFLVDEAENLGLSIAELYTLLYEKDPDIFEDEDVFDIFKGAIHHYASIKGAIQDKPDVKVSEEEYDMENVFDDYGLGDVLEDAQSKIAELVLSEQDDVLNEISGLDGLSEEDALREAREIYASYDFDFLGLSFLGLALEDYLLGSGELDDVIDIVEEILSADDISDDEEFDDEWDDEEEDDEEEEGEGKFVEVDDDEL